MSTPQGNFDTARDESADPEARERAIDTLEAANECDMLAELASMDDLAERYRKSAVEKMAHPQCKQALEELVDSGDLPESVREHAVSALESTSGDAGAGP